jgi:hypothetical protein
MSEGRAGDAEIPSLPHEVIRRMPGSSPQGRWGAALAGRRRKGLTWADLPMGERGTGTGPRPERKSRHCVRRGKCPRAYCFTISWYSLYYIVGIAGAASVAKGKAGGSVRAVRGRFRPKWFSPNGPLNGLPPPGSARDRVSAWAARAARRRSAHAAPVQRAAGRMRWAPPPGHRSPLAGWIRCAAGLRRPSCRRALRTGAW